MNPNDITEPESLKSRILNLLGVTNLKSLKRHPKGGLFGAHPLRALLAADSLAPQGIAVLNALSEDLACCISLPGFSTVRRSLITAEHYPSARLQISIAATLLRRGSSLRLEAPVTREREAIPLGERTKGRASTEIDIHLLNEAVDIEVYTRSAQFFRTFDPEYLREHVPKPTNLPAAPTSLICEIRAHSLLLLSNNDFSKLEQYFLRTIPAALSGRPVAPFTDDAIGVQVTIRTGDPDTVDADFRDSVGIAVGEEPAKHWLHFCYKDETRRDRFFLDLKRVLGSYYFGGTDLGKMTQIRKYPLGRTHVLAVGLPHTLYRFSESNLDQFKTDLSYMINEWKWSVWLDECRQVQRASFGPCLGVVGALAPGIWFAAKQEKPKSYVGAVLLTEFVSFTDREGCESLYRFPVILGNKAPIENTIASLQGRD